MGNCFVKRLKKRLEVVKQSRMSLMIERDQVSLVKRCSMLLIVTGSLCVFVIC